ncbi:MAG: MBL fold metallo-hydrolase [Candidatus Aenigmarchaeota archaeon]|nr:MBL fold metallo-hydrolase [Candidatus Aenigmarchaeota archaeon]MDI6722057.1 MBL fold metallo-hydrolase [Candidatus Aenigmarchaeota archaeon]
MKIKILGAGQEVGRSCIVIEGEKRIVMDCGVKLQTEPPQYPLVEETGELDAAILSHAHLDHCGAMPLVAKNIPVFMNDVTLELATLLIRDSIKVGKKEGYNTPFGKPDLSKFVKSSKLVSYGEKFMSCRLYDAGHIPGSSGIFFEKEKIFYTGDIQTAESNLLRPARLPEKCDTLITESTYAQRNHLLREQEEANFIEAVEEALGKDETALIPVFAVGRAQEVLLILKDYVDKIAMDGMARDASGIVSDYGAYLKNAKEFRRILKKVHMVQKGAERDKVLKKYPIIIASAGMLGGGPAVDYLSRISQRGESKVLFTGFLVEESPGSNLIRTKIFENGREKFDVECGIHQFSLSAHAGRRDLLSMIEKLKPKNIICVHGENCSKFAEELEEKGYNAFAPKNGEEVRL